MLVKGDDLLVLKGETPEEMMEWAAVIYYAMSLHNGGNADIFELEGRRLDKIAEEAERKRSVRELDHFRILPNHTLYMRHS